MSGAESSETSHAEHREVDPYNTIVADTAQKIIDNPDESHLEELTEAFHQQLNGRSVKTYPFETILKKGRGNAVWSAFQTGLVAPAFIDTFINVTEDTNALLEATAQNEWDQYRFADVIDKPLPEPSHQYMLIMIQLYSASYKDALRHLHDNSAVTPLLSLMEKETHLNEDYQRKWPTQEERLREVAVDNIHATLKLLTHAVRSGVPSNRWVQDVVCFGEELSQLPRALSHAFNPMLDQSPKHLPDFTPEGTRRLPKRQAQWLAKGHSALCGGQYSLRPHDEMGQSYMDIFYDLLGKVYEVSGSEIETRRAGHGKAVTAVAGTGSILAEMIEEDGRWGSFTAVEYK